ncbi:MAG: hypothetical protein KBD78_05825 [Oligoflexales bacterium]|nr:hypothetical protein [Oligoflexales bacterium]
MSEIVFIFSHKKTGLPHLLLEDGLASSQIRLVLPSGDIRVMHEGLFDEEPQSINIDDNYLDAGINATQWQVLLDYRKLNQAEEAKLKEEAKQREQIIAKAARHAQIDVAVAASSSSSTRQRISREKKRRTSASPKELVRSVEWSCERLTFYKHRIEPLAPKGVMSIRLGDQLFRLTRADFEKHFNDVIMSPNYRSAGFFSYQELPPRMLDFLVKT